MSASFTLRWERAIPFVPVHDSSLPVDRSFLCRGAVSFPDRSGAESIRRGEWRRAILVAGIFFLLVPLRFAFPRPHADGWLGALFDWFRGMDAPYNLFPSLHAALLLFLIDAYARHLGGSARFGVMLWFVLIGLSPLLTHQHHVIDIIGGFSLAAGCFYFIRPKFDLALGSRAG